MKNILAKLDARRTRARLGGGEKRIASQHEKGKLTARERIEIFNQSGGFVFNAIHNIQGNTPIENVEAMFKALAG